MTGKQIAALKPNVASEIKPWAWWTFDDKAAKDRTGRFKMTNLYGRAKVEDGKLVLNGKLAWLSTAKAVDIDDSFHYSPDKDRWVTRSPFIIKASTTCFIWSGAWGRPPGSILFPRI